MSTKYHTQTNYFWTILNFALMVTFFSLNFQVNAQQKIPLPHNAKLKTIKFKEFNYAAKGYVTNENFVEGQVITFLRTEKKEIYTPIIGNINSNTLSDTIISGTYFIKDGISYLEGKKEEIKVYRDRNVNGTKKRIITKGLFKVTNSMYKDVSDYDPLNDRLSIKDQQKRILSVNPLTNDEFWKKINKNLKKLPITILTATNLDIQIADVYSYQGYLEAYTNLIPVSVQKQGGNYNLKIEFRDRTLESSISYDALKKNNFLDFNFDSFSYFKKCKIDIQKWQYIYWQSLL